MYLDDGMQITNTPSNIRAGYNTNVYQINDKLKYKTVPTYYTDIYGNTKRHDSFNKLEQSVRPGGTFKATPTRTGSWYQPNYY